MILSSRLIRLIEEHGDQIITNAIAQIRRDPEMTHVQAVLDNELRAWGRDLLLHLGHWLAAGLEEDLARRYERIGRLLQERDAPLDQSLRALFLIREKVEDYVEEQGVTKTTIELYAEEELERRLGRFFDLLAIHMTRGYVRALRKVLSAGG